MYKVNLKKRLIAGLLVLVMAFMVPSVHVQGATKQTTYVKTFKLFIKEKGTIDDAKKWASEQGDNWYVVEGDVNAGADSKLKATRGVFLCYETTTDRKEAVTDIAVMNEKGNYSEAAYKRILEQQKQTYEDMVKDMKQMLNEYRANVRNDVTTALQARKMLNGYIDPDSNKRLGDLLMEITDEKLVPLLLQSNGRVVMLIQQQLAMASDTSGRTWLDRLSQLGKNGDGYDALFNQAKKAYNGDEQRALKAIDDKYGDAAKNLLTRYPEMRERMKKVLDYYSQNGLDKMSDADRDAWIEQHKDDPAMKSVFIEKAVMGALASYKYDKNTLFDYFMYSDDDLKGNGIRKLYPMAASLTDAQRAALNESTDIFTIVNVAINQTAQNDLAKGKALELTAEDKQEVAEQKDEYDNALTEWENMAEPISIYDGVDRELFGDGGVAVTSTAESYKTDENKNWADALIDKYGYEKLAIGSAIGAVTTAIGAGVMAVVLSCFKAKYAEIGYSSVYALNRDNKLNAMNNIFGVGFKKSGTYKAWHGLNFDQIKKASKMSKAQFAKEGIYRAHEQNNIKATYDILYDEGLRHTGSTWKAIALQTVKWGLAIASILLAAGDIAMNVYKLYQYYHVEHLPVPHHMVDLSYNDARLSTYTNYKSVKDNSGNCGDVNGGGGRQWLALYETHDEGAGDPILAPETGNAYQIIVQTGKAVAPSESYSPLHMFGTPNTPQNLTYADGESGYSYNDNNNGTYVFFRRDTGAPIEEDTVGEGESSGDAGSVNETGTGNASGQAAENETGVTSGQAAALGTSVNGGYIFIAVTAGLVAGIFIGVVGTSFTRKRKKN